MHDFNAENEKLIRVYWSEISIEENCLEKDNLNISASFDGYLRPTKSNRHSVSKQIFLHKIL